MTKRQPHKCENRFRAEGNNGGSYIDIRETYPPREGMVRLEVGETCVVTVDQEISVCALAAILTACKNKGFQKIVDEYIGQGVGSPIMWVDHDTSVRFREDPELKKRLGYD